MQQCLNGSCCKAHAMLCQTIFGHIIFWAEAVSHSTMVSQPRFLKVQGPRSRVQIATGFLQAHPMAATSAMSHTDVPEEGWAVVGYAAWSHCSFEEAKEMTCQSDFEKQMHTIRLFFPSLMTAVWELRKASVRFLGGTLSSSVQPRKKGLKDQAVLGNMIKVLTEPNFVIFKLLTKENIPSLLATKMLEVADGDGSYSLVDEQNPFVPDAAFLDSFKLVAKQLSSMRGMKQFYVYTSASSSLTCIVFLAKK